MWNYTSEKVFFLFPPLPHGYMSVVGEGKELAIEKFCSKMWLCKEFNIYLRIFVKKKEENKWNDKRYPLRGCVGYVLRI